MQGVIELYSVYSREAAEMMAQTIAEFVGSTYGIGITGQLETLDSNNTSCKGKINQVYVSVYNNVKGMHDSGHLVLENLDRRENKVVIINQIISRLLEM